MVWSQLRLVLIFLAGALMSHSLVCGELVPLPQDTDTPPLELPDLSGQHHNISDYRNTVVLVNFWASWCQPCLKEMPSMQRLSGILEGRPFSILAVDVGENKSTVWRFRKLLNISFTTLLDSKGEVAAAWDIELYPTSYLVDGEGRIRYGVQGALEWDSEQALRAIENLMPDRESATQATND